MNKYAQLCEEYLQQTCGHDSVSARTRFRLMSFAAWLDTRSLDTVVDPCAELVDMLRNDEAKKREFIQLLNS